ncbi:unnamed protein product [Mytilus edulis]|uniref:DZIP3-like HEPN domain-containing protein n=1 Tax=Mytilus edulis TaxID=6550 RepID=A0A8S3PR46_MYTED|nr:unnamed protein product [Mytilus edulis]
MAPRESFPVTTGWDKIPLPGDTSTGADLARVKWYRNQLAHSKDGILSSTYFNHFWGDLQDAIGRLSAKAGLPMLKEAQLAKHVVLDGSLTDMLLELSCKKSQQELTEMINIHQSAIDILRTNKEEQEKKIHQVNVSHQKGEAETQKLSTEPSVYKDECTEKLEACKNDIKKNEEMIKELQDQSDKKQNKIADLILHICKLEIKYEQHDKMLKEHDEHLAMLDGQGSKQGEQIAQQAEQLAQHCEQMAHHSEQMAQQSEQMAQQGEQMAQQGEQMVQQREQMAQQEDTRALIEEDVREGTFVITKAVTDGLLLLKQNGVMLITGYAGNIKVIITIRDTVKRQCQEIFDSHRLFKFNFIDLSSDVYLLSQEEKHTILTKYMETVRQSFYTDSKGFLDCNGDTTLDKTEVLTIVQENPVKGFPLVVYQFVHNDKYYRLGSKFFDRPTEAMLEEMNEIRRSGEEHMKFMKQYAVMVYTAINENCINPNDSLNITAVSKIIDAIYEALEKEDNKDIYTENMIGSVVIDTLDYVRSNVHIKTYIFFAYLLDTVAKLESQLDVYHFVLKIFKKMINTSSSRMSVDYTKFALISSLYVICATKDVRCVKATLDMIEEHKIPVLVDQGVILTEVPNITSMSNFGEEYDDETCVFLTLCIWNAYKVCNIPVLEFLLSKYNHTPFDINLFFKMIYRADWTHNMIPSVRKRVLGRPTLSFEPLKWMIETFPDQELEDPNFILRAACKYQMFDTVEYLASGTRPISRISCLKAFLEKPESLVGIVPFSQELFSFLIKQIDMSSEGLIPFVSSVTQKLDIPDYMFEAFLPVCINNANIFRLACENGQFYLVKLIIESSQIEHLDIQSALVAACTESESTQHHSSNHEKADDEVAKLEIVKYIVDNIGFDQFDFIAICQQAYSSKKIKILEWFVQNIDTTKLDVYTIIDTELVCNRSDILERQMQNIELESLVKKEF